jgi:hypothetical protein
MKDVVIYGRFQQIFSSFLELYFILYKFSNFKNRQVQAKLLQASSLHCALYAVGEQPWPAIAGRTSYGRGKGRGKGPHRCGSSDGQRQQARTDGREQRRCSAASAPKAAVVLGSPRRRKYVSITSDEVVELVTA